jgi:DNA-binding transcriptional ArsR family regulator
MNCIIPDFFANTSPSVYDTGTMLTGAPLREKAKPFAARLAALGHPMRLAILHILAHGPMRMTEIAQNADMAENLAAHHLSALAKGGWIGKTRVGKTVTYHLNERAFFDWFRLFADTPFGRTTVEKRVK